MFRKRCCHCLPFLALNFIIQKKLQIAASLKNLRFYSRNQEWLAAKKTWTHCHAGPTPPTQIAAAG
jgi:hypothetical protein